MSRIRPTTVAMLAARHDEAGNASPLAGRDPGQEWSRQAPSPEWHPAGGTRCRRRPRPPGPCAQTRWCRPSGTTRGVAVTGSLAMTDSTPNTSWTSSAVTTSDGSPAATIEPARIATRWSA